MVVLLRKMCRHIRSLCFGLVLFTVVFWVFKGPTPDTSDRRLADNINYLQISSHHPRLSENHMYFCEFKSQTPGTQKRICLTILDLYM